MVVALLTFIAFLPALRADFVTWDDNRNFLDNAAYRGLGPHQLEWMWTTFHMGHYVPVTWMSHGLDYVLWGMNPFGYHLQNVVWHCVNAVLLYALARRVLHASGPGSQVGAGATERMSAAVAALVFALHPLRVESVVWITERRDVLSLAFCLVSILCFLRAAGRERTLGRWYWLALLAFAIALLAKATSVIVPVALLVLNIYPFRRLGGSAGWTTPSARRVYVELAPFGALAGAAAMLSVVALSPPAQLSLGAKIAVSFYGAAFYVWKTLAPVGLAPLYEMPRAVNVTSARYLVAGVVVMGISAAAWMVRRRAPGATTAWFAFLAMLIPMLGIVQNGPQIVADRYTYHAAPALALLVGGAVARWRQSVLVRATVTGAVLAVLGVLTWRQAEVWHDSERLWSEVLEVDSTSSIAEIALGDLMIAQDRAEEAVRHYGRGVELDPSFPRGFNNLGVALARQGKDVEAIARYEQAIALDPSYSDAHGNWGVVVGRRGDQAAAIEHFRRAIALDPRNADAEINLGNALVRQERLDEAIAHYARAAAIRPDDAATYLNWGVALARQGKFGDAVARLRQSLALRPDDADARGYLDRALEMQSAARGAAARR
jgi:protein O-mannosyl-transferase